MHPEAQEYYNIASWLKDKINYNRISKYNTNNLPAQDSWLLLYSTTTDDDKMIHPGRSIPSNMHAYNFLDKDSMLQCEEIRAVSKSRLDATKGCLGKLEPRDFSLFESKFKRCYNL